MRIVLLGLVLVAAAGCAQAGPRSAADCPDRVRFDDIVCTSYGATERAATPHATADQADCEDTGQDPQGSVFPDDPTQVRTWTFDGYPATQVLGVEYGVDSYGVFIADTVPVDERDSILKDLSGGQWTRVVA